MEKHIITSSKKSVIFVLPSLRAGGAERILSFLAQNINKDIFDSQLLVIGNKVDSVYGIENTKTVFFNKSRVLSGIPLLIKYLKKNKPEYVVSSIGHLNTIFGLLAPFFPKCKFIIREASVITEMDKFTNTNKLYALLSKIAYKKVDAIICQSKDMAIDFKEIHNIPDKKIVIINNPITELLPVKNTTTVNEPIKYITVGRLSKEKGHDRLLEILSNITHPFHYTIVGNGPKKNEIFEKISTLGLVDSITHIPFTTEVGMVLAEHDLFLQGSFVEGFPNAVLESCVVGTPVIAFDAPGGTKEIINNGTNGYLVSNSEEFITKLKSFTINQWEPQTIRKSVTDKFNKHNILKQYEDLLLNL